jgi:hypothetical protein
MNRATSLSPQSPYSDVWNVFYEGHQHAEPNNLFHSEYDTEDSMVEYPFGSQQMGFSSQSSQPSPLIERTIELPMTAIEAMHSTGPIEQPGEGQDVVQSQIIVRSNDRRSPTPRAYPAPAPVRESSSLSVVAAESSNTTSSDNKLFGKRLLR